MDQNRFDKCRAYENWCNYIIQRSCFVSLLRKTKGEYYGNLTLNDITDNKKSRRTIKPYFNEKGSGSDKIGLCENKTILTNENKIANTMSNYFISITKNLSLKPHTKFNTLDIQQLTSTFNNHVNANIKKIR